MDSNRIKRLATGAREQLRREVEGRLDAVLAPGSAESLAEPAAVEALAARVTAEGRERVVDSAAYTWFNRLCALRFMDANDYAPVPAVTPREGSTLPAVLADAQAGLFDPGYAFAPEVRARVAALLTGQAGAANATEAAYAELLRAVCDHYADAMPFLFSEDAASWLLMPQSLLAEGSILRRVVEEMDDESCKSVEVLGWLYQHYIAERKDEVFAGFKKGRKAGSAEIGPATQLFTPEWIVRYLCENSLGRLWMLNNPTSTLADSMDYYIAPDGEEPHVEVASASDIRVLDPACGSGHILVYAFDLLFAMYEEEGWLPEDIPAMILQNNLRGLEVSGRAAEIALFALMMKARGRDPRFLERGVVPDVRVFEVAELDDADRAMLSDAFLERTDLLDAMAHMSEVGSLFQPAEGDADAISAELSRLAPSAESGDAFAAALAAKLRTMLANVEALEGTYHCVIANPPYMGTGTLEKVFGNWVKKNYPDEKGDLCTCFMARGREFASLCAYSSMITMQSWMFLGSYEKMREKLIECDTISTMAHLGTRAFDTIAGEVVSTTAAVIQCDRTEDGDGAYVRLVDFPGEQRKRDAFLEAIQNPDCGWLYRRSADSFKSIPGTPIAYWASDGIQMAFEYGKPIRSFAEPKSGLSAGTNDLFLRKWWEVSRSKTELAEMEPAWKGAKSWRWYSCNKGGSFRKWEGNNEDVIDWENDGYRIRHHVDKSGKIISRPLNTQYSFLPSVTWSAISSGSISFRHRTHGYVYEHAGASLFADEPLLSYLQGACNSTVMLAIANILSPTLNYQIGQIASYPIIEDEDRVMCVFLVVEKLRNASKSDWDSFETSWDFKRHPLV